MIALAEPLVGHAAPRSPCRSSARHGCRRRGCARSAARPRSSRRRSPHGPRPAGPCGRGLLACHSARGGDRGLPCPGWRARRHSRRPADRPPRPPAGRSCRSARAQRSLMPPVHEAVGLVGRRVQPCGDFAPLALPSRRRRRRPARKSASPMTIAAAAEGRLMVVLSQLFSSTLRRLVARATGTIGRPEMRASVTMPSPACARRAVRNVGDHATLLPASSDAFQQDQRLRAALVAMSWYPRVRPSHARASKPNFSATSALSSASRAAREHRRQRFAARIERRRQQMLAVPQREDRRRHAPDSFSECRSIRRPAGWWRARSAARAPTASRSRPWRSATAPSGLRIFLQSAFSGPTRRCFFAGGFRRHRRDGTVAHAS